MQISEELNTIVTFAREEAMRTGSYAITPDHLFLGMLRHSSNRACEVLEALDADLHSLKMAVESRLFQPQSVPYCDEASVKLDRKAQNVLGLSVYEALRCGSENAGSIHLLLALLKSTESICKDCLRSIDIDEGTISAYLKDDAGVKEVPEEKPQIPVRILGTFSIRPSDICS